MGVKVKQEPGSVNKLDEEPRKRMCNRCGDTRHKTDDCFFKDKFVSNVTRRVIHKRCVEEQRTVKANPKPATTVSTRVLANQMPRTKCPMKEKKKVKNLVSRLQVRKCQKRVCTTCTDVHMSQQQENIQYTGAR